MLNRLRAFFKHPMALLAVALPVLVLVPALAVAQTSTPGDIGALIGDLISALQGGHYAIAIGAGLSLLTLAIRTYVCPKWKWAQSDRGGAVISLLVTTVSVVSAELLAGHATGATVINVLLADILSAGVYVKVKKIIWPSDVSTDTPVVPTTLAQ